MESIVLDMEQQTLGLNNSIIILYIKTVLYTKEMGGIYI
jgi:hypothetical protein